MPKKETNAPAGTEAADVVNVPAPAPDFEDFSKGEVFGGSYPQLELNENQVSPLLTYVKDTKIPVTDNDGETSMKTAPVVSYSESSDGLMFSLPISAIFQKHWKEAAPAQGDKLAIKRYPDATKKRGAGAGNKMKVYAVKIYERAVIEEPAE